MKTKSPPRRRRVLAQKGLDSDAVVDRENRIIRGFNVTTRGPALGHYRWLDSQFLDETVAAGNSSKNGLKVRFTHPGLSGDGLGKALGRAKNFQRVGDKVKADLHFIQAASKSPQGDLPDYVMSLAEEDPALFGASIVFTSDRGAEELFHAKHKDAEGRFRSPDKDNAENLYHWRLNELTAVDAVDSPAANPDGFLHDGEETADVAERALCFAFGLTEEDPGALAPGITALRARQFVTEFLDRRGLELTAKEKTMSEANAPAETKEAPATIDQLSEAYPKHPAFVIEQIKAGATLSGAKLAFLELENQELKADKQKLSEQLASKEQKGAEIKGRAKPIEFSRGGQDPLDFAGEGNQASEGDFMEEARQLSKEKNIGITAAMSQLSREKPELHEAFVAKAQTQKQKRKRR